MTMTLPTRQTLSDWLANKFVKDAPLRSDAGKHHRFVKVNGGIKVELNPIRDRALGDAFAVIEKARDDRINGAGALREQKLKDARAAYEAAKALIEQEHAATATTATAEFEAAEQKLLSEYSLPIDAPVPGVQAAG